jgi:hypothetical protein
METKGNNDIYFIEDYLDGKLSSQDKNDLERRLATDMEFAKLYHFRLKIRDDWQEARKYIAINNEVASAIKQSKSRQQKTILYAVAASIAFLVVITGVFSLMISQPESVRIAEVKADSTMNEEMVPQITQPGFYADSGRYVTDLNPLLLNTSVKGDSIVFTWQPRLKNETEMGIFLWESEKEVFRQTLNPGSDKLVLTRNILPAGKMFWYLKDFIARDSFEVD